MAVLTVDDLVVHYEVSDGTVYAVDGVSFDIEEERIVGLLGESGSGKSTVAEALVRTLPSNAVVPSGSIRIDGRDILDMTNEEVREVRWEHIALIPQAAMGSLDPVYTIRKQLLETVFAHSDMSRAEANDRAEDVLDTVDISPARLDDYPHQLSGGMKQRVLLAMSLLLRPEIIIADEPTTGLDVITRDRILNDIERYRDEYGVSVLFISHDIADMVETCDSLITMYGGKIVEMGPTDELFQTPTHPYTMGLKHSLPHIDTNPEDLIAMDMDPPENRSPVDECVFANRCPYVIEECHGDHPDFTRIGGVESACYRAEEAADLRDQIDQVDWNP